jgi:hypothetical protein
VSTLFNENDVARAYTDEVDRAVASGEWVPDKYDEVRNRCREAVARAQHARDVAAVRALVEEAEWAILAAAGYKLDMAIGRRNGLRAALRALGGTDGDGAK